MDSQPDIPIRGLVSLTALANPVSLVLLCIELTATTYV